MNPIQRLDGLVVCVNYADLLARTLPVWLDGLTTLTVVTSRDDVATDQLVNGRCRIHKTDVFYANRAMFNKGAAIAEAFEVGQTEGLFRDWTLFFDADVLPPERWRRQVDAWSPHPHRLYGAQRIYEDGRRIPDPDLAGYFLLFHASCPHAQHRPIVDTFWQHAGNYDSTFLERWLKVDRIRTNLQLVHFGEHGQNWCGRGNIEAVRQLHRGRAERGGSFQHERIG